MKKLLSILSLALVFLLISAPVSFGFNYGWKFETTSFGIPMGYGKITHPAIGPGKPLTMILEGIQQALVPLGYDAGFEITSPLGQCPDRWYFPEDGKGQLKVWNGDGAGLIVILERDCIGYGYTNWSVMYIDTWVDTSISAIGKFILDQQDY